jgi:hypothetical protein
MTLVDVLKSWNSNITVGSWFTSIELIEILRPLRMTYLNMVKKNEREIHPLSLLVLQGIPTRQSSNLETI